MSHKLVPSVGRNPRDLGPPSTALAAPPFPPPGWGQQNVGIQICVGEQAAVKTSRGLATGTLLFQREALLPKLSRKPLLRDAFLSC